MIHPSGTFDYEAEFTIEGFSDSDIVLYGTDRRGENIDCLVGLNPMIRFWKNRIVIVAPGKLKSTCRTCLFHLGTPFPSQPAQVTDSILFGRELGGSGYLCS